MKKRWPGFLLFAALLLAWEVASAMKLLDPVSVQDKHCISAPGDLMASEFNPDATLDVVWTRNTDPTTCGTVTVRDIYFARSAG